VLHFSFDIQLFLVICSRLVIGTLSKLHGELFGKECESTFDKLHSALYTFTVAGTSQMKWISGVILCTLYSLAHSAFGSL